MDNKLTWKCKLFGCKNEILPSWIFSEYGEKHGLKGPSFATASQTLIEGLFKGCKWCKNYKIVDKEETLIWPKWLCDCEICQGG